MPPHGQSSYYHYNGYSPSRSKTLVMALWASSTPKKVAAFAGTARAMAGPMPGKKALNPPPACMPLMVPAIVGLPSALCNLDLIVSMGKTGIQDRKSTRLNSSHSGESRMPSSA